MLKIVTAVISRDLKLAMRRQADIVSALFFFIIVVSLFPLGIGPEPDLLRKLAPGVLWVAALLATMLSLPRLFADDHRDGTLEQLALSPYPLGLVVTGKVIAHWLVSGLPLALIAPVLGIQFDLSVDALVVLTGAILLGTPALSGIGAIGAALTLGLRGGGVLLSLLVLPLYIPVLIFGAGAVDATVAGLGGEGHLSLLAALTFASLGFRPLGNSRCLEDRPRMKDRFNLYRFASPATFYPLAGRLIPWFTALAVIFGLAGLWIGMLVAPTDFQQGEGYRIIFIHVPASWMSMFIYLVMAFWAAIGLAFNTRLSGMMAQALAPTGALMAFISLWTGALWGKPMWGAWWVWDARLTSELILLFLYIGYMALTAAIDDAPSPTRRAA
jgi:heme exporter protein B